LPVTRRGRPHRYYHWDGSLTTPPCSEGVKWYLLKGTQTVTKEQVDKFIKIIGKNNRPIQPINERTIYRN